MVSTLKWRAFIETHACMLFITLLAACFRPAVVDCVVGCDTNGSCPREMFCANGLCTRGPSCLSLAAGEVHSCGALAGKVKCWGGNSFGQLGAGDTRDRGVYLDEMGGALKAVDLGSGQWAVAVAAGGRHSCAVLKDGRVKCWGDNSVGQLGLGDTIPRITADALGDHLPFVDLGSGSKVKAIAAGLWHTCAVMDSGLLKCWGDNRIGQLGVGDTINRGGNPNDMGDNLPPVDLAPALVQHVAPGAYHTCVLLDTFEVKCWGNNEHGETGTVRWAGGGPGQMGDALPALTLGRRATGIAAGAFHTCALLEGTGDVKCWGLGFSGQLGLGMELEKIAPGQRDVTFDLSRWGVVNLGSKRKAQGIASGSSHSCALLDDGSVRCWGYNAHGELGIGSTGNRGSSSQDMGDALLPAQLPGIARAIAVGANHACAVVAGQAFCWGLNRHGQLGVGDDKNRGDNGKPLSPVNLGF
jgi:alpha-tubulin suppressor-like RCC1 family protein